MNSYSVRITIVVDNQCGPGLMTEHGLALFIESGGSTFFFDSGQGEALLHNSRALGIQPHTVNTLVLSHGHYDHTGGASLLLQRNGADLYCHPGVTQPRYAIRNGRARPIQMPRSTMKAIDRLSDDRLHWVLAPVVLSETVGLTGPIPRRSVFEDTGGPFYLDPEGRRVDPVADDMALYIRTTHGLVVCVGCCHAGLVNTLNHVRCLNDNLPIYAVIGGLHLFNTDGDRLKQTISALRAVKPKMLVPCHCTGEQAVAALSDTLGKRVIPGAAGMTLKF